MDKNSNPLEKKVCFISRSAYPLFDKSCTATFGGAEVDLYLLSIELAKDVSYSVSFIVGDFDQPKITKIDGVTIYAGYKANENVIVQMAKLILTIIRVNSNIYFQEGASGGTGVIAFLCKLFKKKFIYRTASDIDCNGKFVQEKKIEGRFYLWGIRNASKVITQNKKNAEDLANKYNVPSVVIKNATALCQQDLSKEKEYILWVGRSEALKQPEIFFRIAKQLPQYKFVMIAPPANFNNIDIPALVKKYNLNNLIYISKVPYDEIDDYFKKADILINTSIYEGFPNTFVQAAKSSAAIFSLAVDPDNFIKSTNSGFVANNNENLLISTLESVCNDKKRLKVMQKNVYHYVKREHDLNNIMPLYKQLISGIERERNV